MRENRLSSLLKHHHKPKGRSISIYSGVSEDDKNTETTSVSSLIKIKGKGEPRLRHHKPETLLQHFQKNKKNMLYGLQHSITNLVKAFETELESASTVTILTKVKLATEHPLIGKTGHLITSNDKTLAVLLSPVESSCSTNFCCGFASGENDPMNYYIVSPNGEELMSISGLDVFAETESTVSITLSSLRTLIATVVYNRLGVDPIDGKSLSMVSVSAGRDRTYAVPTSVVDGDGELLYIFRRDAQDDLAYTEMLSVDGHATTMAEVMINYKTKNKDIIEYKKKDKDPGAAHSFDVCFSKGMNPRDKGLVLGISITIFNQWVKRQTNRKKSMCSIV